ncbi:hypothetical protein E2C01_057965 [Portunus trituberculatus]|uniref:Uncharacterized protein n=1 Tax=Portunus trituberculatus TaxID=210409 RepID=A0A5B7H421_PORTR|nr:hypothetical protein [Portunus trituberculatus]
MPLETKTQTRESQGARVIDAMARKFACPAILESVRLAWLASVPKLGIRSSHSPPNPPPHHPSSSRRTLQVR